MSRSPRARDAALTLACLLIAACASAVHTPETRPHRGEIPPDVATAEADWRAAPNDVEATVWYGRRTAYSGDLEAAVRIYTRGLELHPGNPELLRHRGHRFLSLRRFEEARRDLEQAAATIEGTPDRLELDGVPNSYDIPRGTLHTNVWYHLGLADFLLGRDEQAARAFARCLALANNDDFRVAAAYWRVLALFHLGLGAEARALAGLLASRQLDLMESFDYAELLELFSGTNTRALETNETAEAPLSSATRAYGIAMWLRMSGRDEEARARMATLTTFESSSAFGCLAAEAELVRLAGGH